MAGRITNCSIISELVDVVNPAPTYIFLRQIPKRMVVVSRCLKHSPSLPSPSSAGRRCLQSLSLLHHLKPVTEVWG